MEKKLSLVFLFFILMMLYVLTGCNSVPPTSNFTTPSLTELPPLTPGWTQTIEQPLQESEPIWTVFSNGNEVNDLHVYGNELWAGTTGGLVVWDIEKAAYRKYTSNNGLGATYVLTVFRDDEGNT